MLSRQEAFEIAHNLKQKSNFQSILAIVRNYFFIALIIAINLKFENLFLYLFSVWLIGAFQLALSESLLHESSHYNLFTSRKVNEYVEVLLALPFCNTHLNFKQEHLHHHNFLLQPTDHLFKDYRFFGLIDKDGKFVKNLNWPLKCIFYPLVGISGIYSFISSADFKNPKVISFWLTLFSCALYFGFFRELILFWIIPMIWSRGTFLYWSEFSDHYDLRVGHSRTRTSKISNWFFHNNGYHMTHHEYPFIPFFKLEEAYQKIHKDTDHEVTKSFLSFYRQMLLRPREI